MGKLAKRADPLRARASRVEKSRAQSDSRILPSWYYRVHALRFKGDRESPADFDEDLSELEEEEGEDSDEDLSELEEEEGEDFDEDLSELEEDNEQGHDAEQLKEEEVEDCECEEGEDCECAGKDLEYDWQFEDDESERSYDGFDADYYYELKEEREERKRQKLRQKLRERKEKDREQEIERTKEEEVRTAYRSLMRAEKEHKTIPVESLAGQEFKLFCSDHVNHFYSDYYAIKRVEFYHRPRLNKQKPGGETDMLYGQVYLDVHADWDFGPFRPPNRASREVVKVQSWDGYELSFMFIGNGYLKLRVPREMVFMNPHGASPPASPPTAPEVFEFVGIRRDREKEEAERQMRRSPSPRESWFEMNHPMGAWNLERWLR